jgi:hypothetical protein
MGKRRRILALMFVSAWVSMLSGCANEDEFFGTPHIKTTFRLKSPSAMNGKITISEAYLKLDHIHATGSLQGVNNTNDSHFIPSEEPPYQLSRSDSSQADFNLTARAYDQLDFQLFLLMDSYELIVNEATEEVPEPVEDTDDGDDAENDDEDTDQEEDSDGDQDDTEDEDDNPDDDGEDDNDDDNDQDEGDDDDDGNEGEDNDDEGDNDDGEDGDDGEDDGDIDDKDDKNKDDKEKNKDKDKKDNKGHDHDKDHHDKDHHDKHDHDKNDDDDRDDDDGRASENKTGQTADLDHFFQNAKPGMVVVGAYESNGKVINIIFIASGIEKLSLRAKQNDAFNIVLSDQNFAEITFNPEYWFETITPDQIESAQMLTYQQQTVLFIHRAFNSDLFQALVPRIEGSAELNFSSGE